MYKLRKGNIIVSVFNEYDKESYIKAGWKLMSEETKVESKVEETKVESKVEEPKVEIKKEEPVKEKTILMNKKSKYDRK